MTAEIAIMNKAAVAMAADSAVTVGSGKQTKVYNGVNKLFALSIYRPVGIMVYGQADFMGVPWESIIKLYRQQFAGKAFDSLKRYAADFIEFVETNVSLFPEVQQEGYFGAMVSIYFEHLNERIDKQVKTQFAKKGGITDGQIQQIAAKTIKQDYDKWGKVNQLPSVPSDHGAKVVSKYKEAIKEAREEVFKQLPLSDATVRQLEEICGFLFSKDRFVGPNSGIVIAGFGEDETFPSLASYEFEGMVAGRIKYRTNQEVKIDHDNTAAIVPFAQREMVSMFMEGIDPAYKQLIQGYMKKLLSELYPTEVTKLLSGVTAADKKTIQDKLTKLGDRLLAEHEKKMREYMRLNQVDPIVEAVQFLPKDEVAAMAESLVNLTSFKRRVSLDVETVGGPIDVAVISKGDGFIWIKRKHYFKPELNPQFFANHYGS